MVEQFIKAIRHVRENVQPGDYSLTVGFSVDCVEELLDLIRITGWSDYKWLPESKFHVVHIGPHVRIFCDFNPTAALYHGSVMPHEVQPCLNDPSAAAGLVFGVVGFEKFNDIQCQLNCYFLTPERAVELADDLSFCGKIKTEEHSGTKWLAVGEFVALFLLQESDIVVQS